MGLFYIMDARVIYLNQKKTSKTELMLAWSYVLKHSSSIGFKYR